MAELELLTTFFRTHASLAKEVFAAQFPGAFVLARCASSPPLVIHLPAEDGFKIMIGSEEDCDVSFEIDPTLDPHHATIAYHAGFRGWTVEDHQTSFGTTVDAERLAAGRPLLLRDRQVVKVGGQSELQFYASDTLWARMSKAGITKSVKKQKKPEGDEPPPG
jgi:hypothetical protein